MTFINDAKDCSFKQSSSAECSAHTLAVYAANSTESAAAFEFIEIKDFRRVRHYSALPFWAADFLGTHSFRNILEDAERPNIQVNTLSSKGFEFVDGLLVPHSCVFLNGTLFLWDTPSIPDDLSWKDWTTSHFKLLEVVTPRPGELLSIRCDLSLMRVNLLTEILLLGTGERMLPLAPYLKKYINSLGIQVDTLDSVGYLIVLLRRQLTSQMIHSGTLVRLITCLQRKDGE